MEEVRTGKKLCFAIHTKDQRTFLMIASTSDALANWLAVIRVSINLVSILFFQLMVSLKSIIEPQEPETARLAAPIMSPMPSNRSTMYIYSHSPY